MSTVDEYWVTLLRQWFDLAVIATLAIVLAPATGKPSSGLGSVNTVKSIKVLSCGLCFIGVQWTDEMPLGVSSSAMRIALDARFLGGDFR